MKYLNFRFHIYQPPVQEPEIIHKIANQCYLPLTRQIAAFKDLKFTLNINLSLTEQLDYIAPEVLINIRDAYQNGHLELTESGAYHPIFPLIPHEEVETQLRLNREGHQKLIDPQLTPRGIFPPEMAFEPRLVSVFKKLGYQWTIADDFSLSHYGIDTPYNKIYSCEDMAVFLRSNFWSNKFARYQGQWRSGKDFVEELITGMNQWMGKQDGYLIIALDGETFGHHHPTLGEAFLHEMFQAFVDRQAEIQLTHLSDLYGHFNHVPQFIPPSSWSMDEKNIQDRDYFTLWKSPGNAIHKLQWDFTYYVLDQVRSIVDNQINAEMNKSLFSCQYWWASFWKFDPVMIYKGAFNLMQILQQIGGRLGYERIEEGEKIFRALVAEVEKRQRKIQIRNTSHGYSY
jgi:predicted glycosyl hydrolase (DUF1957 family)